MANSSTPQHSQDPNVGDSGTVRVNQASNSDTTGAQGTVRVQSSVPDQGVSGTVRVGAPDVGVQGTVRVGAPLATGAPKGDRTSELLGQTGQNDIDPQRLQLGQIIELNGTNYAVLSELSANTSEANTYVVGGGDASWVLKRYKSGIRMPASLLKAVKDKPHVNVVKVHDFGQAQGYDVELLEYLPGGTLADLLRRQGPIRDLAMLRRLVRGLADGLDHLHNAVRMIYQDLKPENILLEDVHLNRVLLADFGISTLTKPGTHEVDVTANGTREYAAPELSRFGNQTSVLVSPSVDYFALGVTLLECWTATRPFQNVLDSVRVSQILGQAVPLPADMDEDLATLIKGLLKPLAQDRFGADQVRRWLAGQPLQVDYGRTKRQYKTQWFDNDHSYDTPAQLAALLESDPVKGMDYLYLDMIINWLDDAGDMTLSAAMRKIVREYNNDDVRRNAGLLKAIYTLDNELPFETDGGTVCHTLEEIGDALLLEKAHYKSDLFDPLAPFYLYLQANGAGALADSTYAVFRSKKDEPELAFNTLAYTLHEGGQRRLRLAGRYWYSANDFATATESDREELLKELRSPNSRALIWAQAHNLVTKLFPLDAAEPVDLLSLVKAFPWIQLKKEKPQLDSGNHQARLALQVVRAARPDLLDVYAQQGLSFNVQENNWSPLAWACRAGLLDIAKQLLALGAQAGYTENGSQTALEAAVRYRRVALVEFLLSTDVAANANQPCHDQNTILSLSCRKFEVNGHDAEVHPEIVRLLLGAGADVNQPTGKGELPLHLMLAEARIEHVVDLFEALTAAGASTTRPGANVVRRNKAPCDALFCALYSYRYKHNCYEAYLPVIDRLITLGSSLSAVHDDMAPLHFAASIDDAALITFLLKRGAPAEQIVGADMFAATYAARKKSSQMVQLLSPKLGLRWRNSIARMFAMLGRQVVHLTLILNLFPLGERVKAALDTDPTYWLISWIGALLILSALGLIQTGNLVVFWRGLKLGLRGGWIKLLVLFPFLVTVSAFGVHAAWRYQEASLPLTTRHFVDDWLWLSPYVAVASVLLSMFLVSLAGPRSRAFYNLDAALAGESVNDASKRSTAKSAFVFFVFLIGLVWLAQAPEVQRVLNGTEDRSVKSLLGTTIDSNPKVSVLAVSGELLADYKVMFGKSILCILPNRTKLKSIKPDKRAGVAASFQVTVPQPGGSCSDQLIPGIIMYLPEKVVGFAGKPAIKGNDAGASNTVASASAEEGKIDKKVNLVSGAVTKLTGEGWPIINGAARPLFGIEPIETDQISRFDAWLKVNQHQLECEPKASNRWRCFNVKNADVSLGLLLNGVARASDDAPADYRQAMEKAIAEHRGLWK